MASDLNQLFLEAKECIENNKDSEAIALFRKILETNQTGSKSSPNSKKSKKLWHSNYLFIFKKFPSL
jgi:hypothetical protein